MTRYFFSIRVRDRVLPDREGVELPEDADPRECALFLARKLRSEGGLTSDLSGCFVEVKNDAGAHLALIPVPGSEEEAASE